MNFDIITENSFWAVPLVVAIVETFKMSGFNNKFAPIASLVMGIGLSFLINLELGMNEVVIAGIIYGLSASGLYSSVKSTSHIRGRVPLRPNKEAVYVDTIEVEKPLKDATVQNPPEKVVVKKTDGQNNSNSTNANNTSSEDPTKQ